MEYFESLGRCKLLEGYSYRASRNLETLELPRYPDIVIQSLYVVRGTSPAGGKS